MGRLGSGLPVLGQLLFSVVAAVGVESDDMAAAVRVGREEVNDDDDVDACGANADTAGV